MYKRQVQASVSKSAATGATTNYAAVAQVNTSAKDVGELLSGKSMTYSITVLDKNNNATTTSVTVSYEDVYKRQAQILRVKNLIFRSNSPCAYILSELYYV